MKKCIMVFVFVLVSLFQANCFALMMSDAPGYGSAWHTTAEWQRLGATSTADDGVLWSTDGGTSWGNDAVKVGDNVIFEFIFWTAGYGNHNFDQLVAWADTDHSMVFDTDEELLYEKQYKDAEDIINDVGATTAQKNFWNLHSDTRTYTASLLITEDMADLLGVGGFWLRARVHCNHDTDIRDNQTGLLGQGEVEDWFVNVNPAPVPEPTTLFLLGTGLIGLAGTSRKKYRK